MAEKTIDWLTCSMANIGQEMIRIATSRKHSAEQALHDFLDYAIAAFDYKKVFGCYSYQDWTNKVLSEDEEYNNILCRWQHDVNKAINSGTFCDFFGETYETTFQ